MAEEQEVSKSRKCPSCFKRRAKLLKVTNGMRYPNEMYACTNRACLLFIHIKKLETWIEESKARKMPITSNENHEKLTAKRTRKVYRRRSGATSGGYRP